MVWCDEMWCVLVRCGVIWWMLSDVVVVNPRNSEVFRDHFRRQVCSMFLWNHMSHAPFYLVAQASMVEFKDWSYTNIMTPHCGINEFLDGSAAARWEWRIHQIVIFSGRFRLERLPGTPLQSWDVQLSVLNSWNSWISISRVRCPRLLLLLLAIPWSTSTPTTRKTS